MKMSKLLGGLALSVAMALGTAGSANADGFAVGLLKPVSNPLGLNIKGKMVLVDYQGQIRVTGFASGLDTDGLADGTTFASVIYATPDCGPPPLPNGIVGTRWNVSSNDKGVYRARYNEDLDDVVTISIRVDQGDFPPGTLVACAVVRQF